MCGGHDDPPNWNNIRSGFAAVAWTCCCCHAHSRATTSAQDIIDWAREHMAAYKVPRQVEFVDQLPKSGSGKVMWRLLQDREQAGA